MALYRILSIDGGGIRGIIPAVLLEKMEEVTERPISKLFDMIAGTSTGGIIAAGLTTPACSGSSSGSLSPRFRASELLELYEKRGADIFARSLWDGIVSLGGVGDERYPSDGIERVLKEYLGDVQLKDTLTELLVTSYEIHERRPYFFKRHKAQTCPAERNHLLRDLARATSAAPTYFEPAKVTTTVDGAKTRYLVDGGVFANNPALCAYAEAVKLGNRPEDIFLVSLGTGVATRPICYKNAKDWGMIRWIKPVLSILMDGVADAVDYQLRQMMPTTDGKAQYWRFDVCLKKALDDLDAAHQANIMALKAEARRILGDATSGTRFKELCRKLVAASDGG